MSPRAATVLLTTMLGVAQAAPAQAAPAQAPAFATGTLEQIRERAKTDGRALVIDFSHDAIEPCRRLLQTTWQDATLWKWLAEHALVARIDPEQDRAAATALDVRAYPTIVVLGKDGRELSRILGYVDATAMQQKLAAVIHIFPTDHRARTKLGDDARAKGDLDGALQHYLFVWDHGEEHNPGFGAVRTASFVRKLGVLARQHPPARAALETRRDALERQLRDGKVALQPVQEVIALARALGAMDRLPELLDRVPKEAWAQQGIARDVLADAAIDSLLQQRRHADALRLVGDPVQRFTKDVTPPPGLPRLPLPPEIEKRLLEGKIESHAKVLEACFALRDERAAALVAALLDTAPGVRTWRLVLEAAKRSGNDVACHDLAVRALQELPAEEHDTIRAFLQRK